jgi:TolB-like protein/DNA-binding winged helix-turn-helix (wHTH) protein/tetratricopeptide (TPR) repeat protein
MSALPAADKTRFGDFVVDLRTGELLKDGSKVRLQVQPFQVLALLLRNPGEMVTREELREKLWPKDTFVDFDDGLNTAIRKLRQVLGDSPDDPKFIETLPRRGYRFIGLVSDVSMSKGEPTPETSERVIEKQSSSSAEDLGTKVSVARWMLWTGAAGAGLASILVLLLWLDAGGVRELVLARATPVRIRSIAVLPLENLSGDPAQEYFADGMTDALVTDLAQIRSLRVISRTSVMRYKGTRKPLVDIAKELNVDGVIEGAVVRSAERVRVDAQLIQAATDRHLWASTYERNLGDLVGLQNEIAQTIAHAIQVQLTPQEKLQIAHTQSVDPQAYEFYVKGRYFCDKWTNSSARKSIEYFQQAIQRDANYALAYAGMADAYIERTDLSPQEQFSNAKAMARLALRMDDDLAEAHTALAFSMFAYDWDWAGAEREFQRAIALNPNYAMAHQWYGQLQKAMGRPNWAAEVRRAHELDPLSLIIAGIGQYIYRGQYDSAIENVRRRLELDPEFAEAHFELGRVYARKRMYRESISEFHKAFDLSGGESQYLGDLGYAYALSGNKIEAMKSLKQLEQASKHTYVSPYQIALVYVGLGEKEVAFDWLQKGLADRSYWLLFLRIDERMETIRSDPRFQDLLRRINL